jgi:hypothetical protein
VVSEKTRTGVLRPRRADYELIALVAAAWKVPLNDVVRTMVEHYCKCQLEMELSDRYFVELQPRYDRTPARQQYKPD